MYHRHYKLNLLRHTLRQILDLLVPPLLDVEACEPFLQAYESLVARQTFELRQEERLFSHLHLTVETSLLGEIADTEDILLCDRVAIEEDSSLIGKGYAVDCADKGGLACTVRAQQAIDRAAWYLDRHVVECRMCRKAFGDVFCGDNIAHIPNFLEIFMQI